jgi:hypothetical protein
MIIMVYHRNSIRRRCLSQLKSFWKKRRIQQREHGEKIVESETVQNVQYVVTSTVATGQELIPEDTQESLMDTAVRVASQVVPGLVEVAKEVPHIAPVVGH